MHGRTHNEYDQIQGRRFFGRCELKTSIFAEIIQKPNMFSILDYFILVGCSYRNAPNLLIDTLQSEQMTRTLAVVKFV